MSVVEVAASPITWPLPTEPWAHQRRAFERIIRQPGFLLAHGMGAGKSATTIAALEHDQRRRVLILSPLSVTRVWPDQFQQHAARAWRTWSGTVTGAHGKPKRNPTVAERAEALIQANTAAIRTGQPFAAVVNFEAAWQGQMAQLLLGTDWDALVCDESHRIKKPSGKASQLAARIARRVHASGGRVLCLTGTPMPHSPLDIWAQMRVLDGGERLGTNYHRFTHAFGAPEEIYVAGGVKRTIFKDIRPDRVTEFTRRLAGVMDRVDTADVLDLPPYTDRYVTTDLSPGARRVYDQLERDLIADIDGGVVTAANAMVNVLRLAQATSGFARNADTGQAVALDETPDKARLLREVLDDLPCREPVVVFGRFHEDFDHIRQVVEASGRRYGELSGRSRDGVTDASRMRNDIDVLGCQPQSGGVGIDLTRARHVVFYALDFRLADYEQARARVHRPGQTRPVVYTHLLAESTIDRAVYGALHKRQEVIGALINLLRGDRP